MLQRMTIYISEPEKAALKVIADEELRDIRTQARLLVRKDLERRGLLPSSEKPFLFFTPLEGEEQSPK